MKTNLKALAVTTVVMALVLMARPAVAFPLGSGTFGTSIFVETLTGISFRMRSMHFPWMGASQ